MPEFLCWKSMKWLFVLCKRSLAVMNPPRIVPASCHFSQLFNISGIFRLIVQAVQLHRQWFFWLQLYQQQSSDEPTVHHLRSTKQLTDYWLVNTVEPPAANKSDLSLRSRWRPVALFVTSALCTLLHDLVIDHALSKHFHGLMDCRPPPKML